MPPTLTFLFVLITWNSWAHQRPRAAKDEHVPKLCDARKNGFTYLVNEGMTTKKVIELHFYDLVSDDGKQPQSSK